VEIPIRIQWPVGRLGRRKNTRGVVPVDLGVELRRVFAQTAERRVRIHPGGQIVQVNMSPARVIGLRDQTVQQCPFAGSLRRGRRCAPRHMNRVRLHGTEEGFDGPFNRRGHTGEVGFEQFSRQCADQFRRKLAFRRGARHLAVPAGTKSATAVGPHLLGITEHKNSQGRVQAQIGLPHHGPQGEAELFELAETLYRGAASVIADGLERAQFRAHPLRFAVDRHSEQQCRQACQRKRTENSGRVPGQRSPGHHFNRVR
jgi:hypothetical protein